MKTALSIKEKAFIGRFIAERLSPDFVLLFGSGARNELRPDSDLDLAFLSEVEKDRYTVFMIAQELAGELGRDVDLIDLKKASTVMKAQIAGNGQLLYAKDPLRYRMFTMAAFKEYALLNEERQNIIAWYLSGGPND